MFESQYWYDFTRLLTLFSASKFYFLPSSLLSQEKRVVSNLFFSLSLPFCLPKLPLGKFNYANTVLKFNYTSENRREIIKAALSSYSLVDDRTEPSNEFNNGLTSWWDISIWRDHVKIDRFIFYENLNIKRCHKKSWNEIALLLWPEEFQRHLDAFFHLNKFKLKIFEIQVL